MEIGTSSSLNLYSYLNATSQSAGVLQALTTAYSGTRSSSSDALTSIAGTAAMLPALMSGIYTAATANGSSSSLFSSLSSSSVDATSSASLLASLDTSGTDGLSAAINSDATLALAAYSYQTGSSSSSTTSSSSIQSLLQSAQAANYSSVLNLLG